MADSMDGGLSVGDGADEEETEEEKEEEEVEEEEEEAGPPLAQVLGPVDSSACVEEDAVFVCLLEGRSHRDVVYRTLSWLQRHAPTKLRGWRSRDKQAEEGAALFLPSYTVLDRVVASRGRGDAEQLLVKWRGLGYAACTWEPVSGLRDEDAAAVARFRERGLRTAEADGPPLRPPPDGAPVQPPPFASGCALRDYQRVSFDWMVRNALRRRCVILGDEMGLGKTAQSVAVLEWLRLHAPPALRRPFLVVAPLTTLVHWQREVERWTAMNAVIYDGGAEDKRVCLEHEFYARGGRRRVTPREDLLFDVLLTSYETLRRDAGLLGSLPWGVIVADEAHRLKGASSATAAALRQSYRPGWLLMLTGTPVQNNLAELFGLLHLLDAAAFPSLEEFQQRFCPGGAVEAARIPALTAALRPYLLRRMKEDVETIPEKEEVVVWVEMTADQRAYYKALHEQKMHVLLAANSRKNMPSSRNLLMELRHCCNHPFLLTGVADDYAAKRAEVARAAAPPQPPPSYAEMLVSASGKMLLLSKLLPKLRAEGHKVLIFSQFKLVLDLLEELCEGAGWPAERLDGDTKAAERQAGIDRFNDAAGGGFIYLLSTRAGGMGITLTAADTAVIFDSDWNPQADLQAMARCHRIGQTKAVRVYRLVCRGTCEEAILKAASRKYGLDEALLGGPAGGEEDPEAALADVARIEGLLQHGVMAFSEQAAAEGARFCAEGIDDILRNRAERRQVGSRKGNTFSTATFVAEEAEEVPPEPAPEPDAGPSEAALPAGGEELRGAAFWQSVLPDAVASARATAAAGGALVLLGPRKRRKVDYRQASGAGELGDDDFAPDSEEERPSPGSQGAATARKVAKPGRPPAAAQPPAPAGAQGAHAAASAASAAIAAKMAKAAASKALLARLPVRPPPESPQPPLRPIQPPPPPPPREMAANAALARMGAASGPPPPLPRAAPQPQPAHGQQHIDRAGMGFGGGRAALPLVARPAAPPPARPAPAPPPRPRPIPEVLDLTGDEALQRPPQARPLKPPPVDCIDLTLDDSD